MEDYILADLMKSKELKHISERDFMERLNPSSMHDRTRYNMPFYKDDYKMHYPNYPVDEYNDFRMARMHQDPNAFNHYKAMDIVHNMYHFEGGKKHSGEYFDINKAKEVKEKYKNLLSDEVSVYDVYVAINAQHHDYCALFKSWNRNNVEQRIIESAIVFWFCDADYKGESKIYDCFQMF